MSFLDLFRHPEGLFDLEPEQVKSMLADGHGVRIIDVRTTGEFSRGHIDGAEHIPLGTIKARLGDLDSRADYLLICKTGHRSRAAAAEMLRSGFSNVSHLKGGMDAWNRQFRK